MCDSDEECEWLYRGVPIESVEIEDQQCFGEISPPRLDRVGILWRDYHSAGDTQTAYTSWTTDRSFAVAAAEEAAAPPLSGNIVVFRVRFADVKDQAFRGREDEDEWLLEGRVENVVIDEGDDD